MSKRILVTGGAGFIGSHLCHRLVLDGHHVLCVDNFFTGKRENIADLEAHSRFELIEHDITTHFSAEVEQIYHLACPASPIHYQYNPVKTIKTNVIGTLNMLGLAKKTNACLLQASTSEVYGDPLEHPQKETYWGNVNPVGIRSCYDEGKRCAESLCVDYHRQHNVPIRIVRIFNTYGPNMHPNDGRVVSNFIVQALKNEPITIYGDGSQTRSFQYVDDLVEGMIRMMNNTDNFIGPVNIGNPEEFSMTQLAQTILSLIPESTSTIVSKPLPEDDPKRRKPDIGLAKEYFGWEPRVPLREGLEKTVSYFRHVVMD
ncbi:MAG TPA: NAD-dependent dehydratase [Candidatus Magasanikbacteria bacterium]|nr:MAG: NAD-dependent dehydratase [Candidatus Magasanikbacteria bacterium RIFCSPLOWO2_02_FULL_47_16]OGH79372.1 MAG: NAD-dependent dehydratase [Candidatus Magasanikbacteria bacterium RIFCSPHIGHO2_02_FULL_48_18]OGH83524.1 MAG: NAD-dependent dehydratase [Candidatus Magasanikbacteria bacterium RIFCSPLOWO2_12_FULL_47_9b]HAZ28770.1 NAD-dependent dehydratase [Candidatus Magasanikbacteria bacterium]